MGVLFRTSSKVPTPWCRSHPKHAVAAAEVRQSLDGRGWLVTPDRGWKSSKAEPFPADIPCLRSRVRPDGGNLDFASSEKLPPWLQVVVSVTAAKPLRSPCLPLPPTCLWHHCPATNQHEPPSALTNPPSAANASPFRLPDTPVGILFSQRLPHSSFALLPTCFAVDPAAAESL